jgi:hypothetical protein
LTFTRSIIVQNGSVGAETGFPAAADAPDEGGTVDDATIEALRVRYKALPQAVRTGVLKTLAEQAIQGVNGRGRVPYALGELPSLRRFELTRALVTLCEHDTQKPNGGEVV